MDPKTDTVNAFFGGTEVRFRLDPGQGPIVGADGTKLPMPFRVGDYKDALDRHIGVWDGLAEVAAAGSKAFVWGAPFFLGRRVSVVQEGKAVPGIEGVVGPLCGINTPARSDDTATPR